MNKFYLLLLYCVVLFKASSQPGSLDSTFGYNGIQATGFLSNVNLLNEYGRKVLTSANGDIFVIVQASDNNSVARITKYLPDGKPDSSYGNAGYSNAVNFSVSSAALQGDKIIVCGSGLARYTSNGVLDSSFGKNGIVTSVNGSSIALQGDKLLVGGSMLNAVNSTADFVLYRCTADGILDTSFGENGKVTTDFNGLNDYASSIVLQEDKIVLSGSTGNYGNRDIALARYTADGTLDDSFGENGRVTTDFNDSSDDVANSIALQGGKIIVAGSTSDLVGYLNDFALVRYTAEGVLDTSFGESGKVITDFNSDYDVANSIVLQGDKILVCGTAYNNDTYTDFALARFTADGVLDSSFGVNGRVITDFGFDEDNAYSMALQGDKIIVAGSTYTHPGNNYNTDFVLIRYTADGAVDASFGLNGLVIGYFPSSQTFFTSTILQGDKIIAAGYAFNDNNFFDFLLARFTADGVLDPSFGVNGMATINFNGSSYDQANAIALQGNKIIVAGFTGNSPNFDFALARFTADGRLDSSFGEQGKVITDFNNSDDKVSSIVLQGNKIIVVGSTGNFGSRDFALARYTSNGVLDSSFGKNGKATTDINGSSYDQADAIVLQGDKIIVAGSTYTFAHFAYEVTLARYTTDGVLDASFGVNGIVVTNLNKSTDDQTTSMVLQRGKIIVTGSTNVDFALARYTADGILDSSFGDNGKATTFFNNDYDVASSIALQGDKIIVGGYTHVYEITSEFALARFTVDGVVDSTFGNNGKVITDLGEYDFASIQDIAVHQNRLYGIGSLTHRSTRESFGIAAAYQLEYPEPAISIADVIVSESKKLAIATARLFAPANQIVRVHFTTMDKTAVHPQDYISVSGPLFFIPGVNSTAKIIIPIPDDNVSEDAEQFEIHLTNAHNARIQDSIGVVTIMDNDDAWITKQNTSLRIQVHPNPAADVFTVRLQSSNLKQSVSVRVYEVSGRLVEERNNISIGESLRLGDQYAAGTYIIEAEQGIQKVQTKVIRTGK
ncbi:T9SS type A sorting domain-containing protein [Ilyomonas limi]|uniref:T9SS type A sorting domain-containing protein n=1 Tax=Ilyomonas limi TaxID=2575867 RepID=A0A4U3L272_9BACT|nr:Calx-beta domain-containing protein [Ilyomonas limi]TKK68952.1 T9SS type A sorting domain-containing protein [Ilyomonas limi]